MRQFGDMPLRAGALLAVGALAVHELRYLVAFGADTDQALAAHGHSYLSVATPFIAILLALACGRFVDALARARAGGKYAAERIPGLRTWLAATLALVAIFAVQESIEGVLAAGHPAGVAAVLAAGGWSALPLAIVVGAGVALLLCGSQAALAAAAAQRPRDRVRRPAASRRPPAAIDIRLPSPLARHLAGRAPPLLLS